MSGKEVESEKSVNTESASHADNSQKNDEQQRLFNMQKELERKIEDVNKATKRYEDLEKKVMEKEQKNPIDETKFFEDLASRHGLVDDEGKPMLNLAKSFANMIHEYYSNVYAPKLKKIEEETMFSSMRVNDPMAVECERIVKNELGDLNCSVQRKFEIAKKMLSNQGQSEQQQLQQQYQQEQQYGGYTQPNQLMRPNMSRSSAAPTSDPDAGIKPTDMQRALWRQLGWSEKQGIESLKNYSKRGR